MTAPPRPKLFILANSYTQASAFASNHQLMPGWTYVHNLDVFRGREGFYVLQLPGWGLSHCGGQAAVDAALQTRQNVTYLDEQSDLSLWRRP
jgi:hypothetical protein